MALLSSQLTQHSSFSLGSTIIVFMLAMHVIIFMSFARVSTKLRKTTCLYSYYPVFCFCKQTFTMYKLKCIALLIMLQKHKYTDNPDRKTFCWKIMFLYKNTPKRNDE